jgi:hypothetical protein
MPHATNDRAATAPEVVALPSERNAVGTVRALSPPVGGSLII